jgi:hypothetical protein
MRSELYRNEASVRQGSDEGPHEAFERREKKRAVSTSS